MLTKNSQINRDQVEMIALDKLVPADHLVCKMEATIVFSFIYSMVEDLYSTERGRSSIDPVKGSQLYPESTLCLWKELLLRSLCLRIIPIIWKEF